MTKSSKTEDVNNEMTTSTENSAICFDDPRQIQVIAESKSPHVGGSLPKVKECDQNQIISATLSNTETMSLSNQQHFIHPLKSDSVERILTPSQHCKASFAPAGSGNSYVQIGQPVIVAMTEPTKNSLEQRTEKMEDDADIRDDLLVNTDKLAMTENCLQDSDVTVDNECDRTTRISRDGNCSQADPLISCYSKLASSSSATDAMQSAERLQQTSNTTEETVPMMACLHGNSDSSASLQASVTVAVANKSINSNAPQISEDVTQHSITVHQNACKCLPANSQLTLVKSGLQPAHTCTRSCDQEGMINAESHVNSSSHSCLDVHMLSNTASSTETLEEESSVKMSSVSCEATKPDLSVSTSLCSTRQHSPLKCRYCSLSGKGCSVNQNLSQHFHRFHSNCQQTGARKSSRGNICIAGGVHSDLEEESLSSNNQNTHRNDSCSDAVSSNLPIVTDTITLSQQPVTEAETYMQGMKQVGKITKSKCCISAKQTKNHFVDSHQSELIVNQTVWKTDCEGSLENLGDNSVVISDDAYNSNLSFTSICNDVKATSSSDDVINKTTYTNKMPLTTVSTLLATTCEPSLVTSMCTASTAHEQLAITNCIQRQTQQQQVQTPQQIHNQPQLQFVNAAKSTSSQPSHVVNAEPWVAKINSQFTSSIPSRHQILQPVPLPAGGSTVLTPPPLLKIGQPRGHPRYSSSNSVVMPTFITSDPKYILPMPSLVRGPAWPQVKVQKPSPTSVNSSQEGK